MDLLPENMTKHNKKRKEKKEKHRYFTYSFKELMTSLSSMGPQLNIFHLVSLEVLYFTILRFAA